MSQSRSALARASCFPCRHSKRRCDKTLPACQLCRRKGMDCRYPHRRGQTSASPSPSSSNLDEFVTIGSDTTLVKPGSCSYDHGYSSSSMDGPQGSPSEPSANLAAVRFLAPDILSDLRLPISSRAQDVPGDVAFHLGGPQHMQDVAIDFLGSIRTWMPVVHGRRHLAAVLNPLLAPLRRSRALLALCMKLCSSPSGDKAGGGTTRRSLYLLTKRFHAEVERTEDPCLEIMQATLFIAFFEIAEAIYPAAYFTVGALTRYGLALGLDEINQHKSGVGVGIAEGASCMDIEEMRRVWWGTLILDRLVNISHPTRSLSTSDPSYDDYLPVDDERFLNGTFTPENATRISEAFSGRMGTFARLCQATFLISKVMELTRKSTLHEENSVTESDPSYERVQLCRTLEALVRANESEVTIRRLAFCSQSAVSYLGVLVLQQHDWQKTKLKSTLGATEEIFPETQSAVDTLDRISTSLREGGDALRELGDARCTVFFVDVVYQALLVLLTVGASQAVIGFENKKESLRWLLSHLSKRWPLAGVYETIIQSKEAVLAASAI